MGDHANCEGAEDGDRCNGTLHCGGFRCAVGPATVVAGNPANDTACAQALCDPATGIYGLAALSDGGRATTAARA